MCSSEKYRYISYKRLKQLADILADKKYYKI